MTMTAIAPTLRAVEEAVDVTAEAKRLGFRHRVVLTPAVWADCCYWDDDIEARKTGYSAQETDGRLRDLLWQALLAAKRSRGRRTHFTIERVPVDTKGAQARPVTLSMAIEPGADMRPVITIALPGGQA